MRSYLLTTLLAGVLATASAHAEIVYFDYTATIDRTTLRDASTNYAELGVASISANGSPIAAGNTVRGWLAVDLDTASYDWWPEQGRFVQYRGSESNRANFSVVQSGYTFTTDAVGRPYTSGFAKSDDPRGHRFEFDGSKLFYDADSNVTDEYIYLALSDTNADLVSLWPNVNLANAETSWLVYGYNLPGSSSMAYGTLTSFAPRAASPVPEPHTYAMLSLGLLAAGAAGWRRRRAV